MKAFKFGIILAIIFSVALVPALAMAKTHHHGGEAGQPEDTTSTARKVWDTVWLFLNFFILVGVIVKYGRKPIKDFLANQSAEVADRLESNRAMLAEAEAEFRETEDRLSHIENLIEDVQKYMKDDAARTKTRLLEEAEEKSTAILSEAEERANSFIHGARETLKAELIDLAWQEAEKLIQAKIAKEDEDRLIHDYLSQLDAAAAQG